MDIIKRWLKLKKAQRVRNPWALATALNQGRAQGRGNSGTSKGAYKAGIDRNEWNSPDGMEAATERSATYHGMSPKRKKGFEYTGVASGKKENNNAAISDDDKKGTYNKDSRNWNHEQQKKKDKEDKKSSTSKKSTTSKKGTKGSSTTSKKGTKGSSTKTKTKEPQKATVDGVLKDFGRGGGYDADVEKFVRDNSKKPIGKLAGYETAKPAKRKQYDKVYREGRDAAAKLGFTMFQDDKKAFKDLLKPVVKLYNLRNELSVKKIFIFI